MQMETCFKKLSNIFYQIFLMRQHGPEIKVLWFQDHEITFHQKIPKSMCLTYGANILFKRHWTGKAETQQ